MFHSEYVQSLENEARALRKRNRELEHDMDTYRKYGRAPPVTPSSKEQEEEVQEEVKDNSAVRSHIQSLNDQIGEFRENLSVYVLMGMEQNSKVTTIIEHNVTLMCQGKNIRGCKW